MCIRTIIVLGGGLVKHHVMNANLMRNGADFCVYVKPLPPQPPGRMEGRRNIRNAPGRGSICKGVFQIYWS